MSNNSANGPRGPFEEPQKVVVPWHTPALDKAVIEGLRAAAGRYPYAPPPSRESLLSFILKRSESARRLLEVAPGSTQEVEVKHLHGRTADMIWLDVVHAEPKVADGED